MTRSLIPAIATISILTGCSTPSPEGTVKPTALTSREQVTTFVLTPKFNSATDKRVQNHYSASKTITENGVQTTMTLPTTVGKLYPVMNEKSGLQVVNYTQQSTSGNVIRKQMLRVTPEQTEAGIAYRIELTEVEAPRQND